MSEIHKMKIKVEPGLTTVFGNSDQDVKAIINCTYTEEEQNTFSLIKKENSGSDLVVVSKQEPELTILDEHANITEIRPNHDNIKTPRNRKIATKTCPIVVKLKHLVFSGHFVLLTLLVSPGTARLYQNRIITIYASRGNRDSKWDEQD